MPRFEWPSPLTLERLEPILNQHPNFTSPLVTVTDTAVAINGRHVDRNVILASTFGVTATLPKATGSGDTYTFTVGVLATGGSHIIKCGSTSDVMVGTISIADTDSAGTVSAWATNSTHDTITLNRSTTGSVTKGEQIICQDIANNTWAISGMLSCTGTAITPFSSTVN